MFTRLLLSVISGLLFAAAAHAAPSFQKDVRPILVDYCLGCHSGKKARGGLEIRTVEGVLRGGKAGPSVVPGKPDSSLLYTTLVGAAKPPMPPANCRKPTAEEIAKIRAWIEAGAKDDQEKPKTGTSAARVVPLLATLAFQARQPPASSATPPVSAIAYRSDGKVFAVAGNREVLLIDVASGDPVHRLPAQHRKITAIAFSRDGGRLAVASGEPGRAGEVRIYRPDQTGDPPVTIAAHKDLIHDLAFSPDGQSLVTCSYDRLMKLWNASSGQLIRELRDHSDAVYGVAFSPDGKLLASASADRAVKVWEVGTGKRLYTLSEATEWLYTVAWSPDGQHLAAGGVDKSIRLWKVDAREGQILQSAFAHEAAITRLVYSGDGKTLYSLGEDRTVKAWNSAKLTERKVYARQPETVLSLAVRPDEKQLALGRFDGVAILMDAVSGQVQSQPVPLVPKPPTLSKVIPNAGQRGKPITITLEGKHLDGASELSVNHPGSTARILPGVAAGQVKAEISFPPTTPAGQYQITLKTPAGTSSPLPFAVDLFPLVTEQGQHDSPHTAQKISLPATVAGTLARAGGIDFYRFEAKAGQEIGVQVTASVGGKLEAPVLVITDQSGNVLIESNENLLGFRAPKDGVYAVGIRDREYRGEASFQYRLHIGEIPIITSVFPLGLQRGTETLILLDGVHLGPDRSVKVEAAPEAAVGSRLPVNLTTPLGPALGSRSVVVGEFPETTLTGDGTSATLQVLELSVPGTGNGQRHGDLWRFRARKGQPLITQVNARRLGSPLDSYIEILDPKGNLLPRATLRCVARTFVTFRDHDSAGANIRIESWSDLGINDYLYAGSELLKIKAMPTHPDADCIFFSAGGQRVGYLDTTPTQLPMGAPMYKVEIHPPGMTFPPNGFPVFTIPYRNDDGGPGYGKDSKLFFEPPADGEYLVRIGDTRGAAAGHSHLPYRLTIRPPRPSFNVSFSPTTPSVWKGGAVPITVNADRIDAYEGPIELKLEDLPPGFSAPASTVPAGENSTAFALFAEANATVPANAPPLKLVAKAKINGQEVVREATGTVPKLADGGDIVTVTDLSEVVLKPGGQSRVTVKIERKNGFAGRVPIDVKGLPHGVKVMDIGLNGILITEKETQRTMVLYAEPWVEPQDQPIVVLARREGKNTEHAARSVLLKIAR